jgi:hypothetical protein
MYLRLTRGHVNLAHVDEAITMIPDIVAAIRALPGVQDVRVGIDHETGRTLSLITLDTLEHAQFPRERLGPAFDRLLALGWGPEAPEIYEATIYETTP